VVVVAFLDDSHEAAQPAKVHDQPPYPSGIGGGQQVLDLRVAAEVQWKGTTKVGPDPVRGYLGGSEGG
jgi:hypothetical protein